MWGRSFFFFFALKECDNNYHAWELHVELLFLFFGIDP